MSQRLIDTVLHIEDLNQIRDLLTKQRNEIDSNFFNVLLDASNQHKQKQNYDAAISVLRILFTAGQITRNTFTMAFSLLQVAQIEIARKAFDRSIDMIKRCITECNKNSDSSCVELQARAYHLLGELQYQQYGQHDVAIQSLQEAVTIYAKLQKLKNVEIIRNSIQEIEKQSQNTSSQKPLGDVLDDIVNSRSVLEGLQSDIKKGKKELKSLLQQHKSLQTEVKELSVQYQERTIELSEAEDRVSALNEQLKNLQKRVTLLSTAQQIPLWAAAIRAEIADGEITDLTIPLLSKLQDVHKEYAQPLIAEIRARNGISSGNMIDLSELSGEQRLFAGIANASQIEQTDKIEASEVLLDTWETYLKTSDGDIQ